MSLENDINKKLAQVPYAQTLGVEAKFADEELQLILPFTRDNIGNPLLPALHGGVIGGFMETAAIAQLMVSPTQKELPKPIGINVDYLRRGKPEDTYAVAEITKLGSRISNVRVIAWQSDRNAPIATLHGNFMMPSNDG